MNEKAMFGMKREPPKGGFGALQARIKEADDKSQRQRFRYLLVAVAAAILVTVGISFSQMKRERSESVESLIAQSSDAIWYQYGLKHYQGH